MKYELETIPVWNAYEQGSECALCHLEDESERRNTSFFLGSSIMAPEMRVKLNQHGFCRRHFHMLLGGTGKLGYSLALATHLDDLRIRLEKSEARLLSARGSTKAVGSYCDNLETQSSDCLMCDRIRHNLLNYVYTIVKLSVDQAEFRRALDESKGFCLRHIPTVVRMAQEVIPTRNLTNWLKDLFAVQHRNLTRLAEELEEFTWQFDYQTNKKTPERAQDSLSRAVQKLAGFDSSSAP